MPRFEEEEGLWYAEKGPKEGEGFSGREQAEAAEAAHSDEPLETSSGNDESLSKRKEKDAEDSSSAANKIKESLPKAQTPDAKPAEEEAKPDQKKEPEKKEPETRWGKFKAWSKKIGKTSGMTAVFTGGGILLAMVRGFIWGAEQAAGIEGGGGGHKTPKPKDSGGHGGHGGGGGGHH